MNDRIAEEIVNNFVSITILSAITYNGKESLYDFAEIDSDFEFGICDDVDISSLYEDECQRTFNEWHQIANEMFLERRDDLIKELIKNA